MYVLIQLFLFLNHSLYRIKPVQVYIIKPVGMKGAAGDLVIYSQQRVKHLYKIREQQTDVQTV